jgi:DNA-binding CsgD family transcriptional regulator
VRDWPLVGRDAELGAVFARLERDPSAALVLAGPAGVGKSRLVREVADRAGDRGWSTNVIVGTRAASSIPFLAVAAWIDAPMGEASPVEMLAQARRALTEAGGGSDHLLVVEDGQWLDAGTATLVHQVVGEELCRVVVTVRTGEPVPDAIETLWTGGLAERRELEGLSRQRTGELLAVVLGGAVDGATRHRMWEASGGNLLYLRELVLGALATDSLREEGGIWRLRGSAGISPRLLELIQQRLDALDPDARDALAVLAVAERIDLDQLTQLADVDALERLEAAGVVEVLDERGVPLIALAHPLYGEAVRATMPVLRRRRTCGAVADVVEASGLSRPGDVVRVATWRLDAGQRVDPELLTAAARRAYIANDYALADRLALAARAEGGGVDAGLVLAESAMIAGRHEAAAAMLADLAGEASTDQQRVDVADSRAIVLGLYLGREREATEVVEATLAEVPDPDLVDPLRASLAIVLAQAPRPAAAIDAVQPLLTRPEGPCFYRATYAASIALATCGRLADAVSVGTQGYDAHARLGPAVRFLAEAQFIGTALALIGMGRPGDAAELVQKGYDAAVAARDGDLQAAFALHAGRVAVHEGRLEPAERHFREAAAVYQELNDVASLRWALGGLALASGMRSARMESAAVLAELDALDPSPVKLFELDLVERGRAWAGAAAGKTTDAVAVLRAAAAMARDTDQLVVEAQLRHDIARLGEARAEQDRLTELAEMVDGELVDAFADHARARVSNDAAALEAAAHSLAAVGTVVVAHEAATEASAAWRAGGFRRRAGACDELAQRLAAQSEDARSPAARTEAGYVALTVREQEVATLAADGLTSREIADKLYLSRRTVDNHLQRIYDKLGVSSRQQLTAMLSR